MCRNLLMVMLAIIALSVVFVLAGTIGTKSQVPPSSRVSQTPVGQMVPPVSTLPAMINLKLLVNTSRLGFYQTCVDEVVVNVDSEKYGSVKPRTEKVSNAIVFTQPTAEMDLKIKAGVKHLISVWATYPGEIKYIGGRSVPGLSNEAFEINANENSSITAILDITWPLIDENKMNGLCP